MPTAQSPADILEAGHDIADASGARDWRVALKRKVVVPWLRPYAHPAGRAHFVLSELRPFVSGTVLDVGAGSNEVVFKTRLGAAYRALDIGASYKLDGRGAAGGYDAVVDLERAPLPFQDQSFETVLCMDVLEHLDNIYASYDELFRVAARHVIVSLPNNWPGMIASLLAGHNVTHRAGYGLPPLPKKEGQRHKYFFNLEEACEFLTGRIPADFTVRRVEFRFERGSDGLMFALPIVGRFLRLAHGALEKAKERYGAWGGVGLWFAARAVTLPVRVLDALIDALIWGWGDPVRFYNLFCRQVWIVFERTKRR